MSRSEAGNLLSRKVCRLLPASPLREKVFSFECFLRLPDFVVRFSARFSRCEILASSTSGSTKLNSKHTLHARRRLTLIFYFVSYFADLIVAKERENRNPDKGISITRRGGGRISHCQVTVHNKVAMTVRKSHTTYKPASVLFTATMVHPIAIEVQPFLYCYVPCINYPRC